MWKLLVMTVCLGIPYATAEPKGRNEGMFEYFMINHFQIQNTVPLSVLLKNFNKPRNKIKIEDVCGTVLDEPIDVYQYKNVVFEVDAKKAALKSMIFDDFNELIIAGVHINNKTTEEKMKKRFLNNLIFNDDGRVFISFYGPTVQEEGLMFEFKNGLVFKVTHWVAC